MDMAMKRDYYEVLGLTKGADAAAIKKPLSERDSPATIIAKIRIEGNKKGRSEIPDHPFIFIFLFKPPR